MAEKPAKLRELTAADLNRKERELVSSLFNLRMQVATKQTASFGRIKTLRRDIARLRTVRREIERGGAVEKVTVEKAVEKGAAPETEKAEKTEKKGNG